MQDEMTEEEQKQLLLQYTDQLRLSMAGNLQDYQTENFKAGVWHVLPMRLYLRSDLSCTLLATNPPYTSVGST